MKNLRNTARRKSLLLLALSVVVLLLVPMATAAGPARAAYATSIVYADALGSGWLDWSWEPISVNLGATGTVHAGAAALSVTYDGGWSGLKLARQTALPTSGYDTLRFWIHGGPSGGQTLTVQLEGSGASGSGQVITPAANTWTQYNLPLSAIGSPSDISAVVFFNSTDHAQSVFYLDDIALTLAGLPTATVPPPGTGPALNVSANANQHPISDYIYGLNFADPALAADIDLPVNRWGGNATTRYNYQLDMSNRASDWFFQNIANDNPNPGALPNGSASDDFIDANIASGTDTILTVPLIGWVPKGPRVRACGFSIAKYGPQQQTAPDNGDCGNGIRPGGALVTGTAATDTSVAAPPSFVAGWVQHLDSRYGLADEGGVRFYNLDNEPMLWSHTHRDVHPEPTSYNEMRDRTYAYAAALKAADPNAKLLGPVLWGWTAYFYSALDQAAGGAWWNTRPDRMAHGDVPFVPWYLQQMQAYEDTHGVRLLDYLDLHFYPQGSGVFDSAAGSTAVQQLRLRSTQALWNPNYVDESWIGEPVYLIPRMQAWVDDNYPGTELAITEYNWGAMGHINGAIAQADILGIFGREGLDLATLWDPPTFSQPGAFAFRLYRNYDGAHGHFGNVSVQAASANEAQLAIYAARRTADSALTVMVINKSLTATLTSSVSLAGYTPATSAQAYRYSAANLGAIVALPSQAVSASGFSATFPAQSVTLFVLSPAAPSVPLTP